MKRVRVLKQFPGEDDCVYALTSDSIGAFDGIYEIDAAGATLVVNEFGNPFDGEYLSSLMCGTIRTHKSNLAPDLRIRLAELQHRLWGVS